MSCPPDWLPDSEILPVTPRLRADPRRLDWVLLLRRLSLVMVVVTEMRALFGSLTCCLSFWSLGSYLSSVEPGFDFEWTGSLSSFATQAIMTEAVSLLPQDWCKEASRLRLVSGATRGSQTGCPPGQPGVSWQRPLGAEDLQTCLRNEKSTTGNNGTLAS